MALTAQAMAASVGIAALGGFAVMGQARRTANIRLLLAQIDLVAYLAAAGGVLTLLPEAMATFAPELMRGRTLAGTVFEHFDYAAFVLVSLAFGMGIARRLLSIRLEQGRLA